EIARCGLRSAARRHQHVEHTAQAIAAPPHTAAGPGGDAVEVGGDLGARNDSKLAQRDRMRRLYQAADGQRWLIRALGQAPRVHSPAEARKEIDGPLPAG